MSVPSVFHGIDQRVPEGSTHRLRFEFTDETGAAVALAAITAIVGWLDDHTGATINGRANQDILNLNGGTLVTESSRAVLYWSLDAADAAIVSTSPTVVSERHRVTIKVTYTKTGGGTGTLTHVAYYDVWALARQP